MKKVNVKTHTRKTMTGSTKVNQYTKVVDEDSQTAKLKLKEKEALQNADMVAVDELKIYADNDYDLYKRSFQPKVENLQKKYDKGDYDKYKATKLWQYHADDVSKKYSKEYGSSKQDFDTKTRLALAVKYRDETEQGIKNGEYR